MKKWAQRHPSFVAASVVVLVLLSIGSLVSTAVVHGEQAKTESAYKAERQRAEEAEARLHLAQRSVNDLVDLSEEELAGKPGTERLRKRILESVLSYYRELIEQQRDDPKAQADLRQAEGEVENIVADLTVLQANGQLDLLKQPAVLDDLGLTDGPDGQREKVRQLTGELDQQRRQWFDSFKHPLPPDETRKKAVEQARANDAAVKRILSKNQRERLPQISLQQQGPGAFREPDIAAALKANAEAAKRIRAIDEEMSFNGLQDWKHPGWPSEEDRQKNDKKRQQAITDIRKLLTEEQEVEWNASSASPSRAKRRGSRPSFPAVPDAGLAVDRKGRRDKAPNSRVRFITGQNNTAGYRPAHLKWETPEV